MNNLICAAANHPPRHRRATAAASPRSLHHERSVCAEIVEEILASAGPSITAAARPRLPAAAARVPRTFGWIYHPPRDSRRRSPPLSMIIAPGGPLVWPGLTAAAAALAVLVANVRTDETVPDKRGGEVREPQRQRRDQQGAPDLPLLLAGKV